MLGRQVARCGGELVGQEGPARLRDAVRGGGNRRADAFRQGGERQAGEDVIRAVMAQRLDDPFHVRRAAEHGVEAAVADVALQVVDEERIGIDHDQRRIARQPVEHRAAERADPGAVFDEDLAALPIDWRQHLVDRRAR